MCACAVGNESGVPACKQMHDALRPPFCLTPSIAMVRLAAFAYRKEPPFLHPANAKPMQAAWRSGSSLLAVGDGGWANRGWFLALPACAGALPVSWHLLFECAGALR